MLKKSLLHLHKLHSKAYSYYKVKQLGLKNPGTFSHDEREVYVNIYTTLNQNELVFYDIGAARGVITKFLSKLSNVKTVHAFEPLPSFYNDLKTLFIGNKKIQIHNVALGNMNNEAEFNVNQWETSSSLLKINSFFQEQIEGVKLKDKLMVKVVRLDEYRKEQNLDYPDVVKIDVQGFEMSVIEGGVETISKAKFCIVEMSLQQLYDDSPLFDQLYRYICDLGFTLIALTPPLVSSQGIQLQVDGIFENKKNLR